MTSAQLGNQNDNRHSATASGIAARGAPVPGWLRTVRFAMGSTTVVLRHGMFLFFTVALPSAMFVMFFLLFGSMSDGDTAVGAQVMVRMATYGGLGAAINAGAMIQLERANGWLRQLVVAGLEPRGFVIGKLVAAMVVVLPALLGVYLVGTVLGVPVTGGTALSLLVLWCSMLPLVLLGLVVGLLLKPSAVGAATTIGMMALAVVGGLWFPAAWFPGWLQAVSALTPTWAIAELGAAALALQPLPWNAVLVLAGWSIGLAVAAAALMVRAARTASRR